MFETIKATIEQRCDNNSVDDSFGSGNIATQQQLLDITRIELQKPPFPEYPSVVSCLLSTFCFIHIVGDKLHEQKIYAKIEQQAFGVSIIKSSQAELMKNCL